jgi:hypothetical protein
MWTYIVTVVVSVRDRWRKVTANPDGGYASEAVLVTALLVLGAIVVITIIVAKVTAKANEIDLGIDGGIDLGTLMRSVVP